MKSAQKKIVRANDTKKTNRLNQLQKFLSEYKSTNVFDSDLKRFNLFSLKNKEESITVRELYKIMCETQDGLFKEQLEFTTFTRFLERNGFSWTKPGNHISFEGNLTTFNTEMALFYLLKLNPLFSLYRLKGAKQKKNEESSITQECCLVVEFTYNSYISSISELLYELFIDKIRGITEGRGILRIYANQIRSAKEIETKLESLSKKEPTLSEKKITAAKPTKAETF